MESGGSGRGVLCAWVDCFSAVGLCSLCMRRSFPCFTPLLLSRGFSECTRSDYHTNMAEKLSVILLHSMIHTQIRLHHFASSCSTRTFDCCSRRFHLVVSRSSQLRVRDLVGTVDRRVNFDNSHSHRDIPGHPSIHNRNEQSTPRPIRYLAPQQ